MKLNKILTAFVLIATLGMVACNPVIDDRNKPGQDTTTTEPVDTITAVEMTVSQVLEIANGLEAGAESQDYYQVAGMVSAVQTSADNLVSYGNCNFTLQDETGTIACYYINYLDNKKFTSADQILHVGDSVVVIGKAKNYVNKNTGSSTPELANGYIKSIVPNTHVAEIIDATFAEAIAVKNELNQGATTLDKYRVKGVVTSVSTNEENLGKYGNCNFYIKDPTGEAQEDITCWKTNWLNNEKFSSYADVPVSGDTVVVVAPIQNYNGKVELLEGYIESIVRYQAPPIVVDDDSNLSVPEGTITCAQAIAIGKTLADKASTDETYYIKGIVVKNDTYATSLAQYGNMTFYMADALEDEELFEAFRVYGPDSVKFTDVQQIAAGNVVVVKSKIYNYGGQIETTGGGTAFVYSSTNTFVPSVTPVDPPVEPGEVSYSVTFTTSMPTGWTYLPTSYTPYWYKSGLKLSAENNGVQSPAFEACSAVSVSFTIALNANQKTGTNGTDGNNFKVVALNAEGNEVASQELVTNAAGSYSVDLSGTGITAVQIIMVSFPYNGTTYCNVNFSAASVSFGN